VKLDRDAVFLVECAEDPSALLARRVGIEDGHFYWDDTSRDRAHRIATLERDGDDLLLRTEAGLGYRFRPLTLALYDAHVKARVELSPSFASTAELLRFYRVSSFG